MWKCRAEITQILSNRHCDIASRGLLGKQAFIEMRLVVTATDVTSAHKIVKQVEKRLQAHYRPVRVAISLEPISYQIDRKAYS